MTPLDPQTKTESPLRRWLDVALTVSLIVTCGAVTWSVLRTELRKPASKAGSPKDRPGPSLPKQPISLVGSPTKGAQTAPVGLLEFTDFQCPFCASFEKTSFRKIDAELISTGRLLFAYRALPLASLHPLASSAAEFAECGSRQNKFWELHNFLFSGPDALAPAAARTHALSLGLDMRRFDECLSRDAATKVAADARSAGVLGISGTPTLLIGKMLPNGSLDVRQVFEGAASYEKILAAVNQISISAK